LIFGARLNLLLRKIARDLLRGVEDSRTNSDKAELAAKPLVSNCTRPDMKEFGSPPLVKEFGRLW
jgi:hypothetical protein